MRKLLQLILILLPAVLFAQEFDLSMNVTRSELATTKFPKDSTADALMIYDYGNAYFDEDTWKLTLKYKQKIKILSKEGLDRGEKFIRIYNDGPNKEKITNINAVTYNLEGNSVVTSKLNEDDILIEEVDKNWSIVKLVLPNVKVGSIVTFSYTKTTDYIRNFAPWYFQTSDPVLYSEYNTSIPGNYQYHTKLVGYLPLKTNTSRIKKSCLESGDAYADCIVSKYVMVDLPAYKEESFTTTSENYISHISYELSETKNFIGDVKRYTKSWRDIEKEFKYDKNFGKQLGKTNLIKDVLPLDIATKNKDLNKAKAIYQFVLDNYSWNDEYGRSDASVSRLLKDKGGNAFELNLLLENLLTDSGFKVYPVLVSTRNNGFATKLFPNITEFNYFVLKTTIDGKSYFLDATNPYLAFGELPYRCLNHYGRLLDFENKKSKWTDINATGYSTVQVGTKLKLNEDLVLTGTLKRNLSGYFSHGNKRKYSENPDDYLNELKSDFTFGTIKNHKVISEKKNSPRFKEEMEITLEDEFIGDKIYLNPFAEKFYDENPFKLQERTYPIDFGFKQVFMYAYEVELGNKLKVSKLPENVSLALPNKSGSAIFSCTSNEDKLSVFIKIKLDKAVYAPEYYQSLKSFIGQVVDIQKNTIVVLEKNNI